MLFTEYYRNSEPVISFELFPPKTEKGMQELEARLPRLVDMGPAFMTVTYGALGSTRERTLEIVTRIQHGFGMDAAHHLTCVGSTREDVQTLLDQIRKSGVENIVALRGDPPRGEDTFRAKEGGYSHACQLVRHIRDFGGFGVAVAGYPETHIEATDAESDLAYLKNKVEAGADLVITQLFYDNASYFSFVRRCRKAGIRVPIVPGLLPIINTDQIKRITGICGSSIPERLLSRLEMAGDDAAKVHQVGIEYTVNQAVELLESGVPGIHFYILNQAFHIAEIMQRIRSRARLAF